MFNTKLAETSQAPLDESLHSSDTAMIHFDAGLSSIKRIITQDSEMSMKLTFVPNLKAWYL